MSNQLEEEVQRTINNVKVMDNAIEQAWNEKYSNGYSSIPDDRFVQGFLSGCRFANEYIMKDFRKESKL